MRIKLYLNNKRENHALSLFQISIIKINFKYNSKTWSMLFMIQLLYLLKLLLKNYFNNLNKEDPCGYL